MPLKKCEEPEISDASFLIIRPKRWHQGVLKLLHDPSGSPFLAASLNALRLVADILWCLNALAVGHHWSSGSSSFRQHV